MPRGGGWPTRYKIEMHKGFWIQITVRPQHREGSRVVEELVGSRLVKGGQYVSLDGLGDIISLKNALAKIIDKVEFQPGSKVLLRLATEIE